MSALVQYGEYQMVPGECGARRSVRRQRDQHHARVCAQHSRTSSLPTQVVTPRHLETRVGLSEGQPFSGRALTGAALLLRPVPGWAQFGRLSKTFTCVDQATHSGRRQYGRDGIGWAALEILKDFKGAPNPCPNNLYI